MIPKRNVLLCLASAWLLATLLRWPAPRLVDTEVIETQHGGLTAS